MKHQQISRYNNSICKMDTNLFYLRYQPLKNYNGKICLSYLCVVDIIKSVTLRIVNDNLKFKSRTVSILLYEFVFFKYLSITNVWHINQKTSYCTCRTWQNLKDDFKKERENMPI